MAFPQSVSFGHLLKRHRIAAGLTQEELAEQAGVSRRAIAALETGARRTPRKDTVELLAQALHLSATEASLLVAAARQRLPASIDQPRHLTTSGPDAATQTLPTPTSTRHASIFVGRVGELSALGRHLAGDGPPVFLLAGEPGIGKSRLLHETAIGARERGWTVLSGGCHRRSGQEPFAPLTGALTHFLANRSSAQQRLDLHGCAWLARLLPELALHAIVPAPSWTLPAEQERRLMFAAVTRFLANVAGPAGTLLLLDDLQWAGADALDLLTVLLHSPPPVPLRVVGAYRSTEMRLPDPLGMALADLAVAGLAAQRRLGPLADQEASALLERLLPGETVHSAEQSRQMLSRTGGVPFFLVSCAEALRGEGSAHEEEIPWTVAQSIRQRVAALPKAAQRVLRVAAVMGRQMERSILFAVLAQLGQNERLTMTALEATHQAGLLVETGEAAYQFPHDLIREVTASDLSAARHAKLHQHIAAALEARPGALPLERLAYHYLRSGHTEKAIEYLERAGNWARDVFADADAAGYFRELLALVTPLGRALDEARVTEKLAKVMRAQGHYEEALTLFQRAADAYERGDDRESQWRVVVEKGWVYFRRGMYVEGLAHLRPLMATAERNASRRQLAAALTLLAAHEANTGQHRAALASAARAMELAHEVGATVVQVAPPPVVSFGRLLVDAGRVEEALRVVGEALPLIERTGDLQNLASVLRILSAGTLLQGEFTQSREYRRRALEVVEQTGDQGYRMFQLHARGRLSFLCGDWRAARADAEQAVDLYRQLDAVGVPPQPLLLLGEVSQAEGRREEARALLVEGLAHAERMGEPERIARAHAAFAEWELLEGQSRIAGKRLEPLLDPPDREEVFLISLWALLAWSAIDQGNEAQAEAYAQQATQRARAQRLRFQLVDPLRIQARLAIRQERWADAQVALEESVALCRAMPYPYAEAKALYAYGQLHQAKGESEQAREKYGAALAICDHLGEGLFRPHIARALATLDGHGETPPTTIPQAALAPRVANT